MTDNVQPAELLPEFRVGDILSQTFKTFFANFFRFLLPCGFMLVPFIVLGMGIEPLVPKSNETGAPPGAGIFMAVVMGTMLVGLVVIAFVFSAMTHGSIEYQAGNAVSLRAMFRRGLKAMIPVILSYLMIAPLYLLGAIFLLVPGIIVLVMFSMTMPIIVAEGLGPLAAMRRSRELTDGFKWQIFGCFFLLGLIIQLSQLLIILPISQAGEMAAPGVAAAVTSVAAIIIVGINYGLIATCIASIYTGLREAKEGTSATTIADVFA